MITCNTYSLSMIFEIVNANECSKLHIYIVFGSKFSTCGYQWRSNERYDGDRSPDFCFKNFADFFKIIITF